IATLAADLETGTWPLPAQRFDAIVVCNYLHRPLWPHLLGALAPDGVLLYDTFAIGNERHGKPSNPDYLLRPAELLDVFGGALGIVAFEQGEVHQAERGAVVQRVAAVGAARPWPPALEP
ncbi:MAG: SAM-dependent methyltransferase, partial [Betaproteobacteria bacterium]